MRGSRHWKGPLRRRPEVVFSATVDYNYERRGKGLRLRPGISSNDMEESSQEREIRRVLTDQLPSELETIYGFEVKTRIIVVRGGSLVVFFGAVVSALGFFASYADFFESIALIKKHAQMLLAQTLENRFGEAYDVSVVVEYPSIPDPGDLSPWRRARKMFGPELYDVLGAGAWTTAGRPPRRDGFFWFLLTSTIVLLLLVGALVAAAVLRTYFP